MSWSSYIDNLKGTGHITSAAIVGVKDGGNIWAADPSLHVSNPAKLRLSNHPPAGENNRYPSPRVLCLI